NHPYGHQKAEYFSAVLEGVLIIIAAGLILREAWGGFLAPKAIEAPIVGLLINSVASATNAVWSFVLIRYGRRYRSLALVADGKHLLTDVFTSVGVLVGILVVALTGLIVLDSVLAAIVALNILWAGWQLIRDSVAGLMDAAVSPETLARIEHAIKDQSAGALEAHDLRTRHAGRMTFIDFHLVVPGQMSVADAHEICDRIEAALRTVVEGASVAIHVEPEVKAKHQGIPVLSPRRYG
ncbi:MAG: cadmium transporter, partial [Hyphomicrobiales bacterium]|nr:cadmium transporter [Hyphomicrobiales bacterium]